MAFPEGLPAHVQVLPGDNPARQADGQDATGIYQVPSRLLQWTPHAGCATPVGVDSWSGSGVLCKIEASTT